MILLPNPLPDEHFTSVLERAYLAYSGFKRIQFSKLCGIEEFYTALCKHPLTYCIQFSEKFGLDLQKILEDHSLFPLLFMAIPGISRSSLKNNYAACVRSLKKWQLDLYPHINKFRSFCPQCVAEQYEKFGVTYWKRQWLSNSAYFCMIHRCELVSPVHWRSKGGSTEVSRFKYLACLPQTVETTKPLPSESLRRRLDISEYIEARLKSKT